jgi:hypothetical protein
MNQVLFLAFAIPTALLGASTFAFADAGKPALIVQITADQLRGDLLERYRSVLTHGLARIVNGGYWIRRAALGIHGSPYAADRLVPIIFYGKNILPGHRDFGGRSVDVAPTLAAAAGIDAPSALDGVVLPSILRNRR